jgi:polyphosphate kinase 2 (PPK2 family)
MSGVNPQGCQVFSFKQPSVEDLDHDFLWRYVKCLPERGRIGFSTVHITRRCLSCVCTRKS